MKAKDLAALAALGVAGFAAYDKFGKKGEAKKDNYDREADNRYSSPVVEDTEDRAPMGENAAGSRFTDRDRILGKDAAGSRFTERDVPERAMGKDAAGSRFTGRDVPEKVIGKDAAGSRLTGRDIAAEKPAAVAVKPVAPAPAAKKVVESKRPMGENAAGSRFTSRDATPAQRIAAIDAKSGASSESAKKTEALAAYSKDEQAKDVAKKRAAGTFKEIQQKVKPAVVKPTAVVPTPPLSAAAAARQQAIDEKNFDSDLMKNRRQAVVDTFKNIPANVANAFKPLTKQEIIDQRNYDSQLMRDRREAAFGSVKNLFGFKKGGAVKKMASGGLASSKMSSKPSTASSRGDGIAQRGKTRGQMR